MRLPAPHNRVCLMSPRRLLHNAAPRASILFVMDLEPKSARFLLSHSCAHSAPKFVTRSFWPIANPRGLAAACCRVGSTHILYANTISVPCWFCWNTPGRTRNAKYSMLLRLINSSIATLGHQHHCFRPATIQLRRVS
jgi:hypothetical protein